MAQHAHEMCGEDLFEDLVQAEYEFLGGASCEEGSDEGKGQDLTWGNATVRASNFSLRSLLLIERSLREPEHPFLFTEEDPEDEAP
jgi:hypothetical protein